MNARTPAVVRAESRTLPGRLGTRAALTTMYAREDARRFSNRFTSNGLGLRMVFQGLTCTVDSRTEKGKKAVLLSDVSGYVEPCEMMALMGPSGSGKTTLLDVLAGRKSTGTITGTILYGATSPSPAFLQRHTGYVEQFDTLISTLTVTEMLMYTAELKRDRSEPLSSKAEAVRSLVDRLGLRPCADVHIGDPLTKGISGGQAKRTNIGIAVIADPRVLFLDEPTSGLDSDSAHEVISLVRRMAHDGTTVITTIHAPSATVFAMFDRALLLVRGCTAYFGPHGDGMVQFARDHWPGAGVQPACGSDAEYLVSLVADADRHEQGSQLAQAYLDSQLRQDNDTRLSLYVAAAGDAEYHSYQGPCATTPADLDTQLQPVGSGRVLGTAGSILRSSSIKAAITTIKELEPFSSTTTPWWWALMVLIKYRTWNNYRSLSWVAPRVADKFVFSLLFLTLYLRRGSNFEQNNWINLACSLFMWACAPAMGGVGSMPSIVLERPLFYRERADGLYHAGTYLLNKLLEELVLAVLTTLLFSAYVFFGVQYQNSFLLFWLVSCMTYLNGIVLAYLVAAISPNLDAANALLPAYVIPGMFFAGLIITVDALPPWWRWYSTICFQRYSWGAVMVNQFEEYDPVLAPDGTTLLGVYSLENANKWQYLAYQLPFLVVYTTLAYLALAFVKHNKR